MLSFKEYITEIRRSGHQDVLSDPEGNITYKVDVSLNKADRQSNRGVALANEVKKAGYKFGPDFDLNDFGQGDNGSILVNDAKNPTDARNKVKKLIGKARVKAIISSLNIFKEMNEAKETFLTVFEEDPDGWSVFRFSQFSGGGAKKVASGFRSRAIATKKANEIAKKTGERVSKAPKNMKERNEFRLGRARPNTDDSWIEVDGLSKTGDFWVVDRVFPRLDEADRIAGPFRKKRQAIRVAKELVRETGEKLFFDPDGPDGPLPKKEIRT